MLKVTKLLRELKSDWNWGLYFASDFLGAAYAGDSKIIGYDDFKKESTNTSSILYPFKKVPDKGSFRRGSTNFGHIFAYGDKYIALSGATVMVFPFMWDNDTPDPISSYTCDPLNYGCSADGVSFYLAGSLWDDSEKTSKEMLEQWQGSSAIFKKLITLTYLYDPLVRPSVSSTHSTDSDGKVTFQVKTAAYQNIYQAKRYRIQWSSGDDTFSNPADSIVDFSYNGTDIEAIVTTYGPFNSTDPVQYVRMRIENADGTVYSDWSPTISLDPSNPQDQSFTYSTLGYDDSFPSDYSGTYKEETVYGIIPRGNYLDVLMFEKKDVVSNGSPTITYKIYIDVYDLNGNLQGSYDTHTRNSYPQSLDPKMFSKGGNTYIFDVSNDNRSIVVSQFDGTNVTEKTIDIGSISQLTSNASIVHIIFQNRDLIVFSVEDYDSNWNPLYYAFSWNWGKETVTNLELPIGIMGDLSSMLNGNGFWFEFDDGNYEGVAFASYELFTRQFQRIRKSGVVSYG